MENAGKIEVAYLRCSTEAGHLELQRSALAPLLAKAGGKVKEIAETHSGRFMDGPGLQRVRDMIEGGVVSKIYCYSWDRLGRNMKEGCALVDACLDNGVEVVSLLEPYDLRTDIGRAAFYQVMGSADILLRRLSVNTAAGLRLAKLQGRFKGGSSGKWLSKKTLAKLPKILKYLAAGPTHREIARTLRCDERTVRRIAQEKDHLPTTRERKWDA